MILLGDDAQVEARFSPFRIVLILMQDRCSVCDKRTIGLEIIFDTPNDTPRWRGSSRSAIQSIWR
jgi:hypothetical protein